MESNGMIVGIIDIFRCDCKKNIIKQLKLNSINKYNLYKKSRKYKKDIQIDELTSIYDFIKLDIWNCLYKSNNISIIEPTLILDYNDTLELVKLLKFIKLKFNIQIEILSRDTDFLIGLVDYIFIKNHDIIIKEGNKEEILSDESLLLNNKIKVPSIVSLINYVYAKYKIKLGFRDNTNDLLKDIYRKSNIIKN